MYTPLLLLFLGCLTVQAHDVDISYDDWTSEELDFLFDDVDVRGIIDTAKQLWNKLKDAVKSAIDKAQATLNDLLDSIKALANQVKDLVTAEIQKAADALLAGLNQLKEKAKKAGVDISDCTKNNEDKLKALGKNALIKAASCITDKVQQGTDIVKNVITKANNTYQSVVALGKQIDGCGGSVTCITKLIALMTKELAKFPLQITSDVAKAVKLGVTLKSSLKQCEIGKAGEVAKEGGEILKIIGKCVDDKINHLTRY